MPTGNLLLDSLSMPLCESILGSSVKTNFRAGKTLILADQLPSRLIFITAGLASTSVAHGNGDFIEVAQTGREGLCGYESLFSSRPGGTFQTVQSDISGFHVPRETLQQFFRNSEEFRSRVLALAAHEISANAHLAACGVVHLAGGRVARWILMACDRLSSDWISTTQEHLAGFLGLRRTTVSLICSQLQAAGIISYRRGMIYIMDRAALTQHACTCYARDKSDYQHLYIEPQARMVPDVLLSSPGAAQQVN
jgi:CRP-like cAMP-binding protein